MDKKWNRLKKLGKNRPIKYIHKCTRVGTSASEKPIYGNPCNVGRNAAKREKKRANCGNKF